MYLFALKTLVSDRGKVLTALVGVVFALVLVNIQGGLYFGMIRKSSLLIDNCRADIWIGHRLVENVDLAHDIPEAWLNRVKGMAGVAEAAPYIVGNGIATCSDGGYEDVWIIGFDPTSQLGSGWSFVEGSRNDLLRPHAISVDQLDSRKLGNPELGDVLEINGQRAKVVAKTHGIVPFTTTPYLFTTLEKARQFAQSPPGYCSYYLVRAKPGKDLDELCHELRQRLPELDVYTAADFSKLSQDYWMSRTGIGVSFGMATLLGVLVGLVMVAQSLYAMALDHLEDYATLKAIGAENRHVYLVVVSQALAIASVGSIVGIVTVLVIRHFWSSPLAPIDIPGKLSSAGVGLVFGICLLASILPFRRIRRIDPAIVLQG